MFKLDLRILIKIIFCVFISLFFILIKQVSANSIKSIDMDVYIDNNGNAVVTEVWNTNLTKGTEGYRPYTNLGNSKISNFTVSDENGKQYESLSSWNTNASFDSKAYKSGLHYISKGVELCWGISSYGNKTYTLKYNISNFITQYTDKQGIYFNFLNLDQSVSNVKITIHSEQPFSLDNARIWAFGNNGTINFIDGNIVLDSEGALYSSQYMVALVRFESNIFSTSNNSMQSFDDVYNSAMSTVKNKENDLVIFGLDETTIMCVVMGFTSVIFMVWFLRILTMPKRINKSDNIEYRPLYLGKKIKKNEVSYFREIPCDGDLFYAYWIMIKYNILKEDECKNGLIGAILLKWLKEGYIEISKTRKGLFNLRDNKYAITFNDLDNSDFESSNELEKKLMQMLKEAGGVNNILEANEFKKWCKENYNSLNAWFDIVINYQTTKLQQRALISEDITTKRFLWKSKTIISKYVNISVREEALHLVGLKKFLLDYSLITEKQNLEVHVLEEYLTFAQLLGIADKVEEQFSKLYPDFSKISEIDTEGTSLYTRALAVNMTTTLLQQTIKQENKKRRRARRAARLYSSFYSGSDRDSGGGGSSYDSGGSSAGGSSGGGFR